MADKRRGAVLTSERLLFWTAVAMALVMTGVFARPLFMSAVYVEDDLIGFHLPLRFFYQGCLVRGDSFAWMPDLFMGVYAHGEGQAGMLHPLHVFLYRFLPLDRAFMLELVLSYPFMLLGLCLLLRRWPVPRFAAVLGAATFTYCGFPMCHYVHPNMVAAVAHVPWLLWLLDVALCSERKRSAAAAAVGIGLLTGSQLLCGHPESVCWSGLLEAAYAAFLWPRTRACRRYLHVLAGKVLGVMLGALQWLPTMEMLKYSERAATTFDAQSLSPVNLFQFVSPYLFHRRMVGTVPWNALYTGAVTAVLAVWLMGRVRKLGRLRPLAWAAIAAALAGLFLAGGTYTGADRLLFHLPVVRAFHTMERYVLFVHLGLAVLMAIALAELHAARARHERFERGRAWSLAVLPGVSWLLVLAVALVRLRGGALPHGLVETWVAPTRNLAIGAVLVTAAAGLVFAAARGFGPALIAIVLFATLDISLYGLRHKDHERLDTLLQGIEMPPETGAYRVASYYQPGYGVDVPIMRGVKLQSGYFALRPRRLLDYSDITALRLASVGARKVRYGQWPEAAYAPDRGERWELAPDPMPRVRLVTDAVVSDEPAHAIDSVDIARTAIVDEAVALGGGETGKADILSDRPGRVEVRTEAPAAQLLVISESYHPGWRADIGGQAASVLRVNGDFMGCVVPPGEHRIAFQFDPDSLCVGKWLSLAGAVLTFVYAVLALAPWRGRATAEGAFKEDIRP